MSSYLRKIRRRILDIHVGKRRIRSWTPHNWSWIYKPTHHDKPAVHRKNGKNRLDQS